MKYDTVQEGTPREYKEKVTKVSKLQQSATMQKFSENNVFDPDEKNLEFLIKN
jgi:hypothetical protein